MPETLLQTEHFTLSLPGGWSDATGELAGFDGPLTLARDGDGVGTIQFSTTAARGAGSGPVGPAVLSLLLQDFASNRGWGGGFDHSSLLGTTSVEGASYCVGDEFVRAWYASDGSRLVFAAYVCSWDDREAEIEEVERIMASLEFLAAE